MMLEKKTKPTSLQPRSQHMIHRLPDADEAYHYMHLLLHYPRPVPTLEQTQSQQRILRIQVHRWEVTAATPSPLDIDYQSDLSFTKERDIVSRKSIWSFIIWCRCLPCRSHDLDGQNPKLLSPKTESYVMGRESISIAEEWYDMIDIVRVQLC